MAIMVFTDDPKRLLADIKKAIDDGHVETWSYDEEGDFIHTPNQWAGKAWLRPSVQQGVLSFGILGQKNIVMTKLIYGVYHGRFIEMLLTHFDTRFTNATATAQKNRLDDFKTQD